MMQNVRFLQWKHAQETTNALLKSRASAYERYTNYLRLLGQTAPDADNAPENLTLDRSELTEANFDDPTRKLVGGVRPADAAADARQSADGAGHLACPTVRAHPETDQLYLITNEDAELNTHLPTARDTRFASGVSNTVAAALQPIPSAEAHLALLGDGHPFQHRFRRRTGPRSQNSPEKFCKSRLRTKPIRRASPPRPRPISGAPTNGCIRSIWPRAS